MTRYFYDGEQDEVYTTEQLLKMFEEFKANGDTDEECFAYWLNNCTSKNGSLTEITHNTLKSYVSTHRHELPLVPYYWNTDTNACLCLDGEADKAIVVRPWGDYLYGVDGEPVAEPVFIIIKKD